MSQWTWCHSHSGHGGQGGHGGHGGHIVNGGHEGPHENSKYKDNPLLGEKYKTQKKEEVRKVTLKIVS